MTARITPKAADEGAPSVVKPTIKKETVRIDIPSGPRGVPQATVKIQPAPVAARPPEAVVRTLVPAPVPSIKTDAPVATDVEAHDPMVMYAAWGVLAFAAINFGMQVLTYLTR